MTKQSNDGPQSQAGRGSIRRRDFVHHSVLAAVVSQTPGIASAGVTTKSGTTPVLHEFGLAAVAVDPDSMIAARMRQNTAYLLSLDNDRLLYSFRSYAALPTHGVRPYGGWESPTMGFHGQFVGHYLAAIAMASVTMAPLDAMAAQSCADRARALVAGLADCQTAISRLDGPGKPGRAGYLNAQSPAQFDRLEALQKCDVPYYVIHKIMAGLLDAHQYLGDPAALRVASGMGDYFAWRMSRLSPDRIAAMTETRRYLGPTETYFMEFGGMHEVALRLFAQTSVPAHRDLAQAFDRSWFREMLEADHDSLGQNGEHANTEIPNVLGIATYADSGGGAAYRNGAIHFLQWMRDGHQFANGAVSGKSAYPPPLDYGGELFNNAGLLDRQINGTPGHPDHQSGESCCSHNLNRLTRAAIRWTGDSRWGDEFENRFVNAVLAQQNIDTGMFVYNLNLKQRAKKEFGTPDDTFWCCYGTGVEAWGGVVAGAYLTDADHNIWVNNFIPGTLTSNELGLRLVQQSRFPLDGDVSFRTTLARPRSFTLNIRIPSWAAGATAAVNGAAVPVVPGTFLTLTRSWRDGDELALRLPFTIRVDRLIDRPDYAAIKYGPNLLVMCSDEPAAFDGSAAELGRRLVATGHPCEFTAEVAGRGVMFKPIHKVTGEQYAGYVRVRLPKERVLDEIIIDDARSELDHRVSAAAKKTGFDLGARWLEAGGEGLSCTVKVDSDRTTFIKCRYWGDDTASEDFVRLFDIAIAGRQGIYQTVIATQSLDKEAPGQWWDVVYPIPPKLTAGRDTVQIRFRPKGFRGKPGRAGRWFDRIQTHVYSA